MVNKLLHALANRNSGFEDPLLVGDPTFVPARLSVEAERMRSLLLLDAGGDYYLKVYLACVEAYPDIHQLLDDQTVSYKAADFPPRGVKVNGADFEARINAAGFFLDPKPTFLPLDLAYQVRYHDTRYVRIIGLGTSLTSTPPYTKSGVSPNEILQVQWPADVPFSGPLMLQQDWSAGALVEIEVTPSRFPYGLVVSRLQGNAYLMSRLIAQHLVDEYVGTHDTLRKIALAVTMLALSNPAVYPDGN